MYLGRAQRKIILLYARLFELAATGDPVNGGKVIKSDELFQFVTSQSSKQPRKNLVDLVEVRELQKQRAQRKPNAETLAALDRVVSLVFPTNPRTLHSISDPKRQLDVFSFAVRLGFTASRARYIIDYEYASQLPTYSAVTQSSARAREFCLKHGGLYSLYRHENNNVTRWNNEPHGVVTRSTLSIRYPVPYKAHEADGQGDSRVRCKLNVPGYGKRAPAVYKYDGYVASNRHWSQFLLQGRPGMERNPDSEDLILMYMERFTDADDPTRPRRGVILTQNQDDELNPMVSTVVLIREPGYRVDTFDIPEPPRPKKKENLAAYYSSYFAIKNTDGVEVDEQEFMRSRPRVIGLSDARSWSDTDAIAVQALFDGWSGLNIRGLHI